MKALILIYAAFIGTISLQSTLEVSFLDKFIVPFRLFRLSNQYNLLERRTSRRIKEKFQDKISDDVEFPCPLSNTKSGHIPQSIHKLKPGDIKVTGAIGDSIVAGLGLISTNFWDLGVEERGISFIGGGQSTWREFLTLPNILKVFNPNLIGYSLMPSLSIERASQFNVAETGAISENAPYMAAILVKRIKSDPRVNLQKDWKMINIFIGANNFCSEICYTDPPEAILKTHKADLLNVLRTLRDNLPRTFVNLIPPPDVVQLSILKGLPGECYASLRLFCPCIVGLVYQKFRTRYSSVIAKWQQLDIEIANYDEFNREDFQVVAQPVFVNFTVPLTRGGLTDFNYLAADCFHISQKGSALVANILWNYLWEPVGQKKTYSHELFKYVNCPSRETPYIFTRKNSLQHQKAKIN